MQAVKGLVELEAVDGRFTWANAMRPLHIQTCLDRVFGNMRWITYWLQVNPMLLFGQTSDHVVLYVELIALEKARPSNIITIG